MAAPDKIYVGVGTLSSIQPAEEYAFPGWQEKPYSQIKNEEFIRKDALIEILQGYSHPLTKLVMQEIIEKINSL